MDTRWPNDLDEAKLLQQELRQHVITVDALGPVRAIAGVDAGYEGDVARAAVVVLAYPSLLPIDFAVARRPAPIPYVPGYLSFREAPAVLAALDALHVRPDLAIVDGQGIAHPRRLGIASHLGVLADLPTIGCAKSILVGRHEALQHARGAHVPLVDRGEIVGVALRTRAGYQPVYVSPGHRVSLATSIAFVMGCTTRYRLPETTRAAHALASHGVEPRIAPIERALHEHAR